MTERRTCMQDGYEMGANCDDAADCAMNGCAKARISTPPPMPAATAQGAEQPPSGYNDWHAWAERKHKAGLRQKRCPTCGLWRFPQEKCCPSATEGGGT